MINTLCVRVRGWPADDPTRTRTHTLHARAPHQVNHVNRYLGVVAYIGACHLGPGAWVGVYMDDRVGLYDGCIDGIKYFECEDGYGVLVPPDGVIPIPVSHPGPFFFFLLRVGRTKNEIGEEVWGEGL